MRRRANPSPALLGKVARRAGWGVGRRRPRRMHCATAANIPAANSPLSKRCAYLFDDDRQPADDKVVRKSQDPKSRASEPRVPLGVPRSGFRRFVRRAVRFDDQFARKTNEVRAAGPHRRLPAKAMAIEPVIAQGAPKLGLRPGHVAALRAGELARGLAAPGRLVHLACISRFSWGEPAAGFFRPDGCGPPPTVEGLHDRRRESSEARPSFPHPIRPASPATFPSIRWGRGVLAAANEVIE